MDGRFNQLGEAQGSEGIEPVEVAEYAVANRIVEEPTFAWWVPHTLRKRNRIISKVKSRYWWTRHKFDLSLIHI